MPTVKRGTSAWAPVRRHQRDHPPLPFPLLPRRSPASCRSANAAYCPLGLGSGQRLVVEGWTGHAALPCCWHSVHGGACDWQVRRLEEAMERIAPTVLAAAWARGSWRASPPQPRLDVAAIAGPSAVPAYPAGAALRGAALRESAVSATCAVPSPGPHAHALTPRPRAGTTWASWRRARSSPQASRCNPRPLRRPA